MVKGGMCDQGACMAGDMHGRGHAWQGACMQESRPLKWVLRILLECILVTFTVKIVLIRPLFNTNEQFIVELAPSHKFTYTSPQLLRAHFCESNWSLKVRPVKRQPSNGILTKGNGIFHQNQLSNNIQDTLEYPLKRQCDPNTSQVVTPLQTLSIYKNKLQQYDLRPFMFTIY